jgi:thiazole synthase ThiGH ThiG subunit
LLNQAARLSFIEAASDCPDLLVDEADLVRFLVATPEMGAVAIIRQPTTVARTGDPARIARAFAQVIVAGRESYLAEPMLPRDMAEPSTPVLGMASPGGSSIRLT